MVRINNSAALTSAISAVELQCSTTVVPQAELHLLWCGSRFASNSQCRFTVYIEMMAGNSPAEEIMQNWKKALVCSAVGAGAVLALSGRRNMGIASIAGGLAVLASEYPERFEAIWESAPEYVNRATQIFAALSRISEKFAEDAERRSVASYEQFRHEFGD
jgi:hypothetical protein